MFPLDQLASVLSYDEPFLLPRSKGDLGPSHGEFDLQRLLSFPGRDFQGGLSYGSSPFAKTYIQFQLRYFRPTDEILTQERWTRYPCFLGDRQRAIIGQGSESQYLEEKRARVTFRVSLYFPGLFNISILADENMSPTVGYWSRIQEDGCIEVNWARYGLKPCGKGTAITHYMFEVSRVLEQSLDAWSTALDSIDKLVHVEVSSGDTKTPRS